VFQASAARTGGMRRVRFVTDAGCALSVARLPLPAGADHSFLATVAAVEAAGFTSADRKYLVWMDSDLFCGQAEMWNDDRPDGDNDSNGRHGNPGSVARVDTPCWGRGSLGESVEAHEVMHMLGGVQPSAPNATANGHCMDNSDRMCYSDGSAGTHEVCSGESEALFDCNSNDYFNTNPPPGSYLSRHWNPAASAFLTSAGGPP